MVHSELQYTASYDSPVGKLSLACDSSGKSLTGLWIAGQRFFESTLSPLHSLGENMPAMLQAKRWLDRYFAGKRPPPDELELAPMGSPFRQKVWNLLLEIPYGETVAYGELAQRLNGSSARAAGGAVGHNPISIVIPCHRVIGADGTLTGYAGGLNIKLQLLEFERISNGTF